VGATRGHHFYPWLLLALYKHSPLSVLEFFLVRIFSISILYPGCPGNPWVSKNRKKVKNDVSAYELISGLVNIK